MTDTTMSAADTGLPDEAENDPRHAYLEWLHMEARLLRIELYGDEYWVEEHLTPRGTFAHGFHFPTAGSWQDVPPPSTRAATVLQAAGVQMPEALS